MKRAPPTKPEFCYKVVYPSIKQSLPKRWQQPKPNRNKTQKTENTTLTNFRKPVEKQTEDTEHPEMQTPRPKKKTEKTKKKEERKPLVPHPGKRKRCRNSHKRAPQNKQTKTGQMIMAHKGKTKPKNRKRH